MKVVNFHRFNSPSIQNPLIEELEIFKRWKLYDPISKFHPASLHRIAVFGAGCSSS
jgi:hypothetical protein